MKNYKKINSDGSVEVYVYLDDTPEFGATEQKEVRRVELVDVGTEQLNPMTGEMEHIEDWQPQLVIDYVTVPVDPSRTVAEGLIPITEEEAELILKPIPTDEEILEEIIQQNSMLRTAAQNEAIGIISNLEEDILVDEAEEGDEELLLAWKKYNAKLRKLDVTDVGMTLPERPTGRY